MWDVNTTFVSQANLNLNFITDLLIIHISMPKKLSGELEKMSLQFRQQKTEKLAYMNMHNRAKKQTFCTS